MFKLVKLKSKINKDGITIKIRVRFTRWGWRALEEERKGEEKNRWERIWIWMHYISVSSKLLYGWFKSPHGDFSLVDGFPHLFNEDDDVILWNVKIMNGNCLVGVITFLTVAIWVFFKFNEKSVDGRDMMVRLIVIGESSLLMKVLYRQGYLWRYLI